MAHHGVHLLHGRHQENGEPAQVEIDRAYSEEELQLMPPGPPATLIPKLLLKPSLTRSELPCKPEVLNEESWQQPCPAAYSCQQPCPNEYSFKKHVPEVLQQEGSFKSCMNTCSTEKETSAATECINFRALLHQVELQHLHEVGLVRAEIGLLGAELQSHLRFRAELDSHIEEFRQKAQDPECKQLLQQLLHELREFDESSKGAAQATVDPSKVAAQAIVDPSKVAAQDRRLSVTSKFSVVEIPSVPSVSEIASGDNKTSGFEQQHSVTIRPQVQSHLVNSSSTLTSSKSGSLPRNETPDKIKPVQSFPTSSCSLRSGGVHSSMAGSLRNLISRRLGSTFYVEPPEIEWEPRTRVRDLVEWGGFDVLCSVAILLSAVLLGVSTDQAARKCDPNTLPEFFLYADYAFTTWFLLELCLRMFADGVLRFFLGPSWNWNIFDFWVVAVDLFSTIYAASQSSQTSTSSTQHLSVTRMARMSRLARSLRAIRLFRFLRELRKMVLSIMRSGLHLLYSSLLLSIIIFMFSVYLTQNVTFYLAEKKGESNHHIDFLRECFGSLIYAGYILFQCITTGIGWGEVAKALLEVHWTDTLALAFFMFFCIFAVLNMITGVFVDSALTGAQNERDEKMHNIMEREGELVTQLKEFFGEADADHSGAISLDELKEMIKKPMVRARLRTLEIDLSDAKRVFNLLDVEHTGEVGIEDFIFGCLKMKGSAKSIDVITMMHEMRHMKVMIKAAFRDVNEKFKQQQKIQSDLLKKMSIEQSSLPKAPRSSLTM